MYTYTLTTHCLLSHPLGKNPYRLAYLPNFETSTLTISKLCLSVHTVFHIAKSSWKKTLKHDHGGKQTQPTIKRVSYWR